MDIKRFIIGILVGGITLYILGYIIFDVSFAGFYEANAGSATGVSKDPQVIWAVALGTLSYAAMVTLAIGTRAGSVTIVEGAKVGAVVGFLLWFTVNLIFFGIMNISNLTLALVDALLELVRGGIGGAAIAAVLGKITS